MPKYLVKAEFYDTELERTRLPGEEIDADGERLERLRAADVIGREPVGEHTSGGKTAPGPDGLKSEPEPEAVPNPEPQPAPEQTAEPAAPEGETEHKPEAAARGGKTKAK